MTGIAIGQIIAVVPTRHGRAWPGHPCLSGSRWQQVVDGWHKTIHDGKVRFRVAFF
jgi:hypothetical protein